MVVQKIKTHTSIAQNKLLKFNNYYLEFENTFLLCYHTIFASFFNSKKVV